MTHIRNESFQSESDQVDFCASLRRLIEKKETNSDSASRIEKIISSI